MQGPVAGWYTDPGGSGGQRYWDGSGWTQSLRPPPGPVRTGTPPGPQAPAHGYPPQGAAPGPDVSPTKRRTTPWVIGAAAFLVVAVALAGVLSIVFQRGATSPIAAAEGVVDAVNDGDFLGIARLVAPDEVDPFRRLVQSIDLPEDVLTDETLDLAQISLVFGEPQELTEGVEWLPVRGGRVELNGAGLLSDSLDVREIEAEFEAFFDDPNVGMLAVRRGGRWFISPLGTILEVAARESRLPGASLAAPRTGSSSPQEVADDALRFLTMGEADRMIDLLDPEELQVLDHYRPLLAQHRSPGSGGASIDGFSIWLDTEVQGSIVDVRRIEISDGRDAFAFDLTTMCIEADGQRDCVGDFYSTWSEDSMPWEQPAWQAVLSHGSTPLRIATVLREDRTYLSISETIAVSVEPVIERVGMHNLYGATGRPDLSQNAVEAFGVPGEIIDVPLHDNWNAIRFTEEADLRACPPGGQELRDWQVGDGFVETERIDDASWGDPAVPGVVVGVRAQHSVESVQVRLVRGSDPC